MRRVLATVAAALVLLIGLIVLYYMVNVTGLPLCDDPGSVIVDDCIEAGSTSRTVGIVAGWLATVVAFAAFGFGVRYAFTGRGGMCLVATAAVAPVLAIATLALVPVSF